LPSLYSRADKIGKALVIYNSVLYSVDSLTIFVPYTLLNTT
jgi:hypothetical protein